MEGANMPVSLGADFTKDLLTTLAAIVGSISFVVFIALFGRLPVFRKTPIGWTHRFLMVHIPKWIVSLDEKITGKRVTNTISRIYHYLMYDRHPVVMIIFIILQLGSEVFFIPAAWHRLPPWHRWLIIPVFVSLPYITLYLCYATSAHHITPASYPAALSRYPYDHTLYHPHQNCRTCQWPKPARSKHCPICKSCIERQDHHCIWINNCVGLHNYHYFVALLIAISTLLCYGAITGWNILGDILQESYVPRRLTAGSLTSKRWSTGISWTEWINRYMICIALNTRIGVVTLLATMTYPLALGFFVYHVYLIWAGMTTNETAKWSDLREDIYDDLIWKAKIDEVKKEYPGPLDGRIVYDPVHYRDKTSVNGQAPSWAGGIKAKWWIIRTRGGKQPTRWRALDGELDRSGKQKYEEVIDDRWTQVKSLKEVDNLYDTGVAGNIRDGLIRPLQKP